MPNWKKQDEIGATKYQTKEMSTQTPHPAKRTAPVWQKELRGQPRANPHKSTLAGKGSTLMKGRPVDFQKSTFLEKQGSDIDETPRSYRDSTVEKARCVSHYATLSKASKPQSEAPIHPFTHRSTFGIPQGLPQENYFVCSPQWPVRQPTGQKEKRRRTEPSDHMTESTGFALMGKKYT